MGNNRQNPLGTIQQLDNAIIGKLMFQNMPGNQPPPPPPVMQPMPQNNPVMAAFNPNPNPGMMQPIGQSNFMNMGNFNQNSGGIGYNNGGYPQQPNYGMNYGQGGGGYQGQGGFGGGNTGPIPDNPALRNLFNRENGGRGF